MLTGNRLYFILKSRPVVVHLVCWTLFIANELFDIYLYSGTLNTWYIYAVYYIVNISSFYIFIGLMNDWTEKKSSFYLRKSALIILVFLISVVLKVLIDQVRFPVGWPVVRKYLLADLTRTTYFLSIAVFYRAASYLGVYRQRAAEAKMAYLQQQLQPHLLFNSLNLIYNRVHEHSESAAKVVWLLAELLRFSLQPADADGKIELATEAGQLQHLAELHPLRLGEASIQFKLAGNLSGRIIPLVLLTLAENIFKHGDLTKPVNLSLAVVKERLVLQTSNYKKAAGNSRGTGLPTTRLRLDHTYGKDYQLQIKDGPEHYQLI